jgi:dephospho-CoA kinase
MPAIGITGGVATGKSTFCKCLRELIPSAEFFDADEVARRLTDEDPDVKREIGEIFGSDIYSSSGDLNRGQLRAIILESAAKRKALEQILHPRIRRQWSAEAQRHRNSPDFFLADIPLLYETGGENLCDSVVVVACSPEVQLERLLERAMDGRTPPSPVRDGHANIPASQELRPPLATSEAMELINTQMPLDEKIRRADHVIWNNDGPALLSAQANDLVKLWQVKTWTRK